MSTFQLLIIAVLSGAGTFLVRFLPLILTKKQKSTSTYSRLLHQALAAIGPSAIVALLVVSVAAELSPTQFSETATPIIFGLFGVWIGRKLSKGNVAVATLSGVGAYAVATYMVIS